ncbi:reticulon-like protein B14 [Cucumis melo var. makuwa]|uniref:Reticulon-like protein n=1 Tax=Cucumis melo var. makuwa TaxID=1194695 RepID=A0A5D3CCB1_CUCMM|nr:reticulon-like protein B14 [Cucumis melo var. makuwa]TYK09135.1 reticulon-like protein B14 [Cucumis melo var. makuwa]
MSNPHGRRSFLYSILGNGKVAELMLWKNKKESAAMVAGMSGVWLMVEVLDYHLITLICHLLIILMLLLFLWKKLAFLPVPWSPPTAQDLEISDSSLTHLFQTFNWFLHSFFQISNGNDFKLFAMVMGSLWLLSVIGELVSLFDLVYIVFVSLQVVPVVYDKYEEEFNKVASCIKSKMDCCFHFIDSNFLTKIPRWHHIKQS